MKLLQIGTVGHYFGTLLFLNKNEIGEIIIFTIKGLLGYILRGWISECPKRIPSIKMYQKSRVEQGN